MKVGVTGATGFVGTALVERLGSAGHRVVRFPSRAHLDIRDAGEVTDFVRLHSDLDAVVHLAGLAHSPGSTEQDHDDVNRGGTANLVAAMTREGIGRLIHVSTANVYDPAHTGAPIAETVPIAPRGPYARSKAAAEEVVRAHVASPLVLRPPSMYAEDWLLNVRKRVYMPGTGGRLGIRISHRPAVSLCARSTLVRVVEHALATPKLVGILNVADLYTYRQIDLADAVFAVDGRTASVPLPGTIGRAAAGLAGLVPGLARVSTNLHKLFGGAPLDLTRLRSLGLDLPARFDEIVASGPTRSG